MSMSATDVKDDWEETLAGEEISPESIFALSKLVHQEEDVADGVESFLKNIEDHVGFSDEDDITTRKATISWILGDNPSALSALENSDDNREARFITGIALKEEGETEEALSTLREVYREHEENGEPSGLVFRHIIESLLKLNRIDEARDFLSEESEKFDNNPDVLYSRGFIQELTGLRSDAFETYRDVLEIDEEHIPALFRQGNLLYTQARNVDGSEEDPDELALNIFEKILDISPAHEGAVMNLGIIYEDKGDYEQAKECYSKVLDHNPNHVLAEMYYRDVEASENLSFQEEQRRQQVERGALLNTSMGDFDFPDRILDAFEKLNVETVGDLIQVTEDQLLACDNFGHHSLERVKNFLDQHDLELAERGDDKVTLEPVPPPEDVDDILRKKIDEFDWSARSKRAMNRLSIHNLADLVKKTEEELLDCQNFGETSLQEVKDTLNELGLSLADSGE